MEAEAEEEEEAEAEEEGFGLDWRVSSFAGVTGSRTDNSLQGYCTCTVLHRTVPLP